MLQSCCNLCSKCHVWYCICAVQTYKSYQLSVSTILYSLSSFRFLNKVSFIVVILSVPLKGQIWVMECWFVVIYYSVSRRVSIDGQMDPFQFLCVNSFSEAKLCDTYLFPQKSRAFTGNTFLHLRTAQILYSFYRNLLYLNSFNPFSKVVMKYTSNQ